jgi:hypothetical protein
MQEIVFSFDLLSLGWIFCIVFPLYVFLLRKQIYTWFDPLLTFVFFNSISVAFVIYLYFFMHTIKLEYLSSFLLCITGFILGVVLGGWGRMPKWTLNQIPKTQNIAKSYNYDRLVDVFMVVCVCIMLFSNLLMLIIKGTLPVFSENPSEAKVLLYTGGWGLVRRINLGLVNYVLAIPLVKLFHPSIKLCSKKKIFHVVCILLCVLVLISMGSKSSLLMLLNILFAVFIVNKTFGISITDRLTPLLKAHVILNWAKYIFVFAVSFIVLVVALSGVETSSTDALITRLVASGDTFYFFYVFDLASNFHNTFLDFIPHLLNPLTAMLRLTSYEFPIGAYIVNYSIGIPLDAMSTFGPNAQHPIEGLIYFGAYGAPFYSLIVGFVISYIRVQLLRKIGPYPNCLVLVIYVVLCSIITIAATDVPLFMQVLYDELIYGVIIVVISAFIVLGLTTKLENE